MHENSRNIILAILIFPLSLLAFDKFAFPNTIDHQQNNTNYLKAFSKVSCLESNEFIDYILPYEIFDKSQEQIKYRKNLNQLFEIGCSKDEKPNITRGNIRIENIQLVFKIKINEIDKKIEFYENISKYKMLNKYANERIGLLTNMKQIYSGIIAINSPIESAPELQGQDLAKAYIALEQLRK